MITPNSVVKLISGVTINPKNQIDFANATKQMEFFNSKVTNTFERCTYIRDTGNIRVPVLRDRVDSCNYLMYQNTSYGNKWFFGYITGLSYINDGTTEITFEIDPFQTWLFDFTLNPCMVERKHTERYSGDTPILNTTYEGLEIGSEYEILSEVNLSPSGHKGLRYAIINSTKQLTNHPTLDKGGLICGAVSTLYQYVVPVSLDYTLPPKLNGHSMWDLPDILSAIQKDSELSNAISSVSIIEHLPYEATVTIADSRYNITAPNIEVYTVNNVSGKMVGILLPQLNPINETMSYGSKYQAFGKPTESKLLTYPYCYLEMVDYKGSVLEIKLESLSSNNLNVVAYGTCGHIPYTVYGVDNYNGTRASYNHCIIDEGNNALPVLNDHTATYVQGNLNQLKTQHATAQREMEQSLKEGRFQTGSALLTGVASTGLAVATGGLALGGVVNSIGSVAQGYWSQERAKMSYDATINQMNAQKQDIQRIPPNISIQGNSSAYNMSHDINGVYIRAKRIKPEYMEKVSNYFHMFGYAMNQLLTPEFKSRKHFNYIKTVGCMLSGNIPQPERLAIEGMFDNGLTVWHGDYVGDYSQTNEEV